MRKQHTRALGYARVSSAEQAIGTSLQDQQDVITAYARASGVRIDRMYVEAESAVHEKIERREQIRRLMADVRKGDLVLVDKLDRWSRDPEFTYGSIRQILTAGANFFAIGDSCDPSTSEGDTALGFRILFAREEHKRIRLRMVGTREALRNKGYFVDGSPPWGYRRQDVRGAEKNTLVIVGDEAERVRRAFRWSIEGRSLNDIAEALSETRDRVYYALHNRTYLGETQNTDGVWTRGKHEPIVDADLFMRAADAMAGRRHGAHSPREGVETSTWWLRDIARCALCGAKMSAAYGGTPENRRHYFACYSRCTSRLVRVDAVEAECMPMVEARLVDLRAELVASATQAPSKRDDVIDIGARRAKLARKRERYVEAFADGAMSRDELRVSLAKIDDERTRLEATAVPPVRATDTQRRLALRDIEKIRSAWSRVTPIERRQIIPSLARAVRIAAGQTPQFDWKTGEEIAQGRA